MNKDLGNLNRRYASTMRAYLGGGKEALLHDAYELGREALARGLGVLDMARIHQQSLGCMILSTLSDCTRNMKLQACETFFLEALSPFEITYRGVRAANAKLEQVIGTLAQRNAELAQTNRALHREISQRKRTEKALRQSEGHFRQLFHHAQNMQESLRRLSNQILHVQEEERRRISRELHDEVGQALTAILVNLAVLHNYSVGTSGRLQSKIAETQRLLEQTMESVHRFAHELRPAMLDELGLLPALRSYVKNFATRTGLRVHFRATPAAEQLDGEKKTVIFRIAQESLTNVSKHAHAQSVEVTLRRVKGGIGLEIHDDGKSFSPVADGETGAARNNGLGLLGMQERVRLVDGKLFVVPDPGKGTLVRVRIPFHPSAARPERKGTRTRPRRPAPTPQSSEPDPKLPARRATRVHIHLATPR
jgi:signal transduction histidine kinase